MGGEQQEPRHVHVRDRNDMIAMVQSNDNFGSGAVSGGPQTNDFQAGSLAARRCSGGYDGSGGAARRKGWKADRPADISK